MTCGFCGDGPLRALRSYRSPFVGFSYTLLECRRCGSAFFDAAEHQVDLDDVYRKEARDKSALYPEAVRRTYYWHTQVETLSRLHRGPVAAVLDVGCRTGDFLVHWPETVRRVGVELASESAAVAARRGLEVVCAPIETASFDRAFDVVGCYAIVEHLRDPAGFLDRLAGLVARGGIAVVMIPTRQCLKRRFLDAVHWRWHMYSPPQHLNFPSREALDGLFDRRGFRLLRRVYTSGANFNPLRRVPFAADAFNQVMLRIDHASVLNRLAVFDHMYSFYEKRA
jgi:SAM-dependent methyltransferase